MNRSDKSIKGGNSHNNEKPKNTFDMVLLQASAVHSQKMDYGNKVLAWEWNHFRQRVRRIIFGEILERIWKVRIVKFKN